MKCIDRKIKLSEQSLGIESSKIIGNIVERGGNSQLILSRNRLGDSGLSLLSRSVAKSNELVYLDISNNSLTFRGIQALFHHLKQNYSLVEVNLASRHGPFKNIVGLLGAKAIATYFHQQGP